MPPACSRLRSRRARSSGGQVLARGPSSSRGSATSRSSPVARSRVHRQVTGSVPPRLRRNTTRSPSGEIVTPRGAPRVNRRVRACRRGKLSVTVDQSARRRAQSTQGDAVRGDDAGRGRRVVGSPRARRRAVHRWSGPWRRRGGRWRGGRRAAVGGAAPTVQQRPDERCAPRRVDLHGDAVDRGPQVGPPVGIVRKASSPPESRRSWATAWSRSQPRSSTTYRVTMSTSRLQPRGVGERARRRAAAVPGRRRRPAGGRCGRGRRPQPVPLPDERQRAGPADRPAGPAGRSTPE